MRAWIKERFRVLQVRAILHIHFIHSFFHDIKSTRFIYHFGPYLVAIWSVMLITSRCSPAPTSKLLPFPPPKPGTWLQHRWWGLRGRRWWGSVAIWFLQIVNVAGKQNKGLKPRDPYLAPTNHLYRGHCFMARLLLPKQRADSSLFSINLKLVPIFFNTSCPQSDLHPLVNVPKVGNCASIFGWKLDASILWKSWLT